MARPFFPTAGLFGWRRDTALALALVILVALAYARTWQAGFIWDDDMHVTANPVIIGPRGLADIWTSASANYFPLVLTTFWTLHKVWGLNPVPYHVTNVLMQAAGAVLLWLVLRRLRVRGAWLGAAIWALHPVQVDSVAWISELKNTQAAIFFLLATWFFVRWIETGATRLRSLAYVAVVVCAALAILSKASTVMLPVALLLCWWWQTGTWNWRRVLQLSPLFGLSLLASGWTIWEQKYHSFALGPEWDFTFAERAVIAGKALWFYLGKLLWPHPLIFIYPRWAADVTVLGLVPLLGALGLFAFLWRQGTKTRGVFFAAAFFGALIFPVLGFFNVYYFRYSFVADHFQHLASMGPLALVGAGIATVSERMRAQSAPLAVAIPAAVLLILGALTWRETHTYRNTDILWRTTYERNPSAWMAATILGNEATAAGRLEEALRLHDAALRVHPTAFEIHYNRGLTLKKMGRFDEAIAHYRRALALKPNFPEAEHNLGIALVATGGSDAAIPHFQQALRLKSDQSETHLHLAIALAVTGRLSAAAPHFREALRLMPDSAEAHYAFARTLQANNETEESLPHYQAALRMKPQWAEAHYYLAIALRSLNRTGEASEHAAEARRLRPDLPPLL